MYVLFLWTLNFLWPCMEAVNINVTFTELSPKWKSPFPSTWNVTISTQTVKWKTGTCPGGFYCPQYNTGPVQCPLGTYYPYTGRPTVCTNPCPLNYYCINANTYEKCPNNTVSPLRSSSKLNCSCITGYSCTYTKQVNLHVVLHVPPSFWLSDPSIQQHFVQAVAEAAGVPVENVILENVLPHLGSRRLLEVIAGHDGGDSQQPVKAKLAAQPLVDLKSLQTPKIRSSLQSSIHKTGRMQVDHLRNKIGTAPSRTHATLVRARVMGATHITGLDTLLAKHPLMQRVKHKSWAVSSIHVEKQDVPAVK